ncbi:hypothetical protein K7X08_029848 [Anisodus acutangulus]|uniref:Uncharacterized protein n=1 Tax=Anisodus acutangulus TaxID=402998 RepID=A0A9Q1RCH3_9SOLA|nr:hypothetical protein K7X08_029848 [Anisodus acutangulus]
MGKSYFQKKGLEHLTCYDDKSAAIELPRCQTEVPVGSTTTCTSTITNNQNVHPDIAISKKNNHPIYNDANYKENELVEESVSSDETHANNTKVDCTSKQYDDNINEEEPEINIGDDDEETKKVSDKSSKANDYSKKATKEKEEAKQHKQSDKSVPPKT